MVDAPAAYSLDNSSDQVWPEPSADPLGYAGRRLGVGAAVRQGVRREGAAIQTSSTGVRIEAHKLHKSTP